jgi:hypothetical protein
MSESLDRSSDRVSNAISPLLEAGDEGEGGGAVVQDGVSRREKKESSQGAGTTKAESNLHSNTQPSALERTTPNVPDHLECESSDERRLRRVQSDVAGWDQLDLMKPEGQIPSAEKFSSSKTVRSHCAPVNPGWHWHSFVSSAGGHRKVEASVRKGRDGRRAGEI